MKGLVGGNTIEDFVNERGIKNLVHFTRVENLSSILNNGLIPVSYLSQKRMDYINNDDLRLDDCEDANCISIQYPNYQMFYKYRNQNRGTDWVILGIKKEVLWKKDCVFCVENAASGRMLSTSLDERRGVEALKRLYDEYPGKPLRTELKLRNDFPTHPQAEVLVFDIIEPELIWGVAFKSQEKLQQYCSLIPPTVKSSVETWLYSYRHDYEHWRI